MDLKSLLSTPRQGADMGAGSQAQRSVSAKPFIDSPKSPLSTDTADVYHASGAPDPANLIAQGGIRAYVQLINAISTNELYDDAASMLTSNLSNASAALKLAYSEVISKLPIQLQQKDWKFSISDDNLVFTEGADELSVQDLADLQNAFTGSNISSAAAQLSTTLMSIEQARKSGADAGSLAWGRLEANDTNSGDVVDLRAYVTATAPGSNYKPNAPVSADHSRIPEIFGGMDLRNLVTARPNFLRADGSVRSDALDVFDAPDSTPDIGTLHGRCACGEVCFIVEDTFEYAYYCHCSQCRIRTGSAFAAVAGIGIDKVQVTAGHEHLLIERECSDGYGARCKRCYAFIFSAVRDRQYIHVSLGALVDSPGRAPDHHIYVGSKAPWYQIADTLPQFAESP
jgi:hypothetical protein